MQLDSRRYKLEFAVVALTLLLLLVTAAQALFAQKQVDAAQQQSNAALQQIELASAQLWQGQYQSVYDRLLDMDRLLAEQPSIAPHILYGYKLGEEVSETEGKKAASTAAMLYVLDFYNYIWDNVPSLLQFPSQPIHLALRSFPQDPSIPEDKWEAWVTWSETIAAGFRDSPELCTLLDQSRKAYGVPFVRAIRDAHLCTKLRLPTDP